MTDVRKFIEQTADMDGKPPIVDIIRLVTEQVKKLGVHNRHDKVEGIVGIRDNDEQRRLAVADAISSISS